MMKTLLKWRGMEVGKKTGLGASETILMVVLSLECGLTFTL